MIDPLGVRFSRVVQSIRAEDRGLLARALSPPPLSLPTMFYILRRSEEPLQCCTVAWGDMHPLPPLSSKWVTTPQPFPVQRGALAYLMVVVPTLV